MAGIIVGYVDPHNKQILYKASELKRETGKEDYKGDKVEIDAVNTRLGKELYDKTYYCFISTLYLLQIASMPQLDITR